MTRSPDVSYARSGGVAIAYQTLGDGPATIVYAPHLCSIDALWERPDIRAFLERIADQARLIVYNPRGTGLSDRPRAVTLESRVDDINAVMEAVDVEDVTLFGVSESANACAMFASTYPDRCRQLVLFQPYARLDVDDEEGKSWIREMREHWGERDWMRAFAEGISPAYVGNEENLDWFVRSQRRAASPAAAADFARMQVETDITDLLPSIRVPTLILARRAQVEEAAAVAGAIEGAELLEISGVGHDPYVAMDEIIDPLVARAGRQGAPAIPDSVLATLLFTDLTDSTAMAAAMGDRAWGELLAAHHADVRREVARYRGVEIDSAGDGFFCRFDGPARAIACARSIVDRGRAQGVIVRAGIHTGECEMVGAKPAGIAVHIGARVLGIAHPGEVLVTSTVRDLVAGAGFSFERRGDHDLKGIPGRWALFAVGRPDQDREGLLEPDPAR